VTDPISPQALSELIGSIYDCALDPSRWEETLADLMDALDGHNAALSLNDLRHDRILLNKTVGMDPQLLEHINKHAPRSTPG